MFTQLFAFITILATVAQINGGEFYELDDRTYFVSYPETRNWYQAMRYCSYIGMYLVDVVSAAENQRILSIIKQSEVEHKSNARDYWTCGTDLGSKGEFYWASSGHQLMFGDWNASIPSGNDGLQKNCLHYWQGYTRKWNAWRCDENMFFVCRDTFDVPVCKTRECSINTGLF